MGVRVAPEGGAKGSLDTTYKKNSREPQGDRSWGITRGGLKKKWMRALTAEMGEERTRPLRINPTCKTRLGQGGLVKKPKKRGAGGKKEEGLGWSQHSWGKKSEDRQGRVKEDKLADRERCPHDIAEGKKNKPESGKDRAGEEV